MRNREEEDYSPNGFQIFGGIFQILFGLFFMIPLMFPFMGIDLIIDEGINPRTIGILILFIVIASPFVVCALLVMGNGYSQITGWNPNPKRSLPGNPRPKGRDSVVFGGHRSSLGPIFITMLLLPFLFLGPGLVVWGLISLFSEATREDGFLFFIFGLLVSSAVYYLAGSVFAKRTLRIDHKMGILYYKTVLFGRQIHKDIRPIIEVLEVREWVTTSYDAETGRSSERTHHAIFGEGDNGRWMIDIAKMTMPNFIDPEEIAKTLGVPFEHGKPR